MKVEKQIDDALIHRTDLIRVLDAAADFLASKDADADSQAIARWRLWSSPNGESWIGVNLHEHGLSLTQQYLVNVLANAEDRELRLVHLWNHVLRDRTRRAIDRGNALISQYQGEQ